VDPQPLEDGTARLNPLEADDSIETIPLVESGFERLADVRPGIEADSQSHRFLLRPLTVA
jgi:hypothetical protein